ncbi:methyl-CpG-binding domain-containing protein 6-like [Punica granatum]|uniref:MBD domain-containing protein n=2 Tax=Punica granatum TaxID=22663 RepID=A0A218W8C7_PUNGR|nr:methyl-CpG-binding domain-containing protein 6-like [Punica granatum]OWM68803.1 hypothetical protein CDL15_Pgr024990 [Punica granatum]PKI36438.1 hypothetical protein CRG98_043220 [Punica granatum]
MSPTANPSSPHLNPADSDRFAGTLPPDPLLQSGCFIDATATTSGETLVAGADMPSSNGADAATPIPGRRSDRAVRGSPPSGAPKSSSNGGEPVTATAESAADGSEDSKPKRRRRLTVGERRVAAGETPDWLPSGWIVEDRVRSSGATAGLVDKYYCDPVSGHVFRSKKEVLYFLETGTKRKKSADSSDVDTATGENSGSHKKASAALKAPPNFDFNDPPEKVTWVLTDSSEGSWAPCVNAKAVPESTVREWAAAFKFTSSKKR